MFILLASFFLSMGHVDAFDVCDLSLIYNDMYQYSLPKAVMESFLSGAAFDHQMPYTEEERFLLKLDINDLYQSILSKKTIKQSIAVITAGAPGSGKTTRMEQDLALHPGFAYVDPDEVCLLTQERTYLAEIKSSNRSVQAFQHAYNKWRPGSNASAHLILGNLIREKLAFYFGSTSTGPGTPNFFKFIKDQGYYLRLIHITAPDDIRWASIEEKSHVFIHTTEQDVKEKGLLLPQRITDTYMKYADVIEFYYRGAVHADAELAAIWQNGEKGATLEIINPDFYEKIKSTHNRAVETLGRPELLWERVVEFN